MDRSFRGGSEPPLKDSLGSRTSRTGLRSSGQPIKLAGITMGSSENLADASDDDPTGRNGDPYSIFGPRNRRSVTPIKTGSRRPSRDNNDLLEVNNNSLLSVPFGGPSNATARRRPLGMWGQPLRQAKARPNSVLALNSSGSPEDQGGFLLTGAGPSSLRGALQCEKDPNVIIVTEFDDDRLQPDPGEVLPEDGRLLHLVNNDLEDPSDVVEVSPEQVNYFQTGTVGPRGRKVRHFPEIYSLPEVLRLPPTETVPSTGEAVHQQESPNLDMLSPSRKGIKELEDLFDKLVEDKDMTFADFRSIVDGDDDLDSPLEPDSQIEGDISTALGDDEGPLPVSEGPDRSRRSMIKKGTGFRNRGRTVTNRDQRKSGGHREGELTTSGSESDAASARLRVDALTDSDHRLCHAWAAKELSEEKRARLKGRRKRNRSLDYLRFKRTTHLDSSNTYDSCRETDLWSSMVAQYTQKTYTKEDLKAWGLSFQLPSSVVKAPEELPGPSDAVHEGDEGQLGPLRTVPSSSSSRSGFGIIIDKLKSIESKLDELKSFDHNAFPLPQGGPGADELSSSSRSSSSSSSSNSPTVMDRFPELGTTPTLMVDEERRPETGSSSGIMKDSHMRGPHQCASAQLEVVDPAISTNSSGEDDGAASTTTSSSVSQHTRDWLSSSSKYLASAKIDDNLANPEETSGCNSRRTFCAGGFTNGIRNGLEASTNCNDGEYDDDDRTLIVEEDGDEDDDDDDCCLTAVDLKVTVQSPSPSESSRRSNLWDLAASGSTSNGSRHFVRKGARVPGTVDIVSLTSDLSDLEDDLLSEEDSDQPAGSRASRIEELANRMLQENSVDISLDKLASAKSAKAGSVTTPDPITHHRHITELLGDLDTVSEQSEVEDADTWAAATTSHEAPAVVDDENRPFARSSSVLEGHQTENGCNLRGNRPLRGTRSASRERAMGKIRYCWRCHQAGHESYDCTAELHPANWCPRCLDTTHWEDSCWVNEREALCTVCTVPGHLSSVHYTGDFRQRKLVIETFGWLAFKDWFKEPDFWSWWNCSGFTNVPLYKLMQHRPKVASPDLEDLIDN